MRNSKVISLVSRIRRAANTYLEQQLKELGLFDLVPSHGDILVTLYHRQEISMLELSKAIDRTKATTTVLVDKLEKQGLVTREKSATDHRIIMVHLTDKGKSFEKQFNEIGAELNQLVLKNFTEDEILTVELLLQKIITNLEH